MTKRFYSLIRDLNLYYGLFISPFVLLFSVSLAWAQAPPPLLPTRPAINRPLVANPKPANYDAGPLGRVYVTGVVTVFGQWQNHALPIDREWNIDVSNAQIFLNKTDGWFQYFVQVGAYSIPDLGVPYIRARDAINDFFGPFPQGFIRLVPTSSLSISAGKLPTLVGAEYTFSFENMNIQRGLLWNQENEVNRGVQINYTNGPIALAGAWNDGFYSNQYSWVWGAVTWTVNKSNTLKYVGGSNTRHSTKSTIATPLFQNNEQIHNLIYTYSSGPWIIQPYFQYTRIPKIPKLGAFEEASTVGGAILASYTFGSSGFSLPGRLEYITSTGRAINSAPNLLYGPGSNAWSASLTPTWQRNIFFARGEVAFVGAMDVTPGYAFGRNGTERSQTRVVLEAGLLF